MLGKKVAQGVFPTTKASPEFHKKQQPVFHYWACYHSQENVFLNIEIALWNNSVLEINSQNLEDASNEFSNDNQEQVGIKIPSIKTPTAQNLYRRESFALKYLVLSQ